MNLAPKPYPISISLQPNVDIVFNAFPYAIPVVHEMNVLEFPPDVTFDTNEWVHFASEESSVANAQVPLNKRLQGFDVVSFAAGTCPECSPLSWNSLTITIPVNQHCLFDTFDLARNAVEQRLLVNSEPGPYRIFSVYALVAGSSSLDAVPVQVAVGQVAGFQSLEGHIAVNAHCNKTPKI